MLNYIWLALMILAVVIGGLNNSLDQVIKGGFEMAEKAVMNFALPLAGIMAIWLGLMRLAEKSGLVLILAKALRPVLRKLFPDVPADHPAMGSMVMNMAANMLGLGNAATPLGLRAMNELQKLNPHPGTASNAMCTFLAINTASIQLIPATAIGILASKHAENPTTIVGTALLATLCAQATGLTAVKIFEKMRIFRVQPELEAKEPGAKEDSAPAAASQTPELTAPAAPLKFPGKILLLLFLGFFLVLFVNMVFPNAELFGLRFDQFASDGAFSRVVKSFSLLAIPFFLSFFPLYAALRRIKVYDEFVEGAKEGFAVAIRIIPYLVAILAAVGMFRGAHGIEMVAKILKPLLDAAHFPPELLSLALLRPLSGSGSNALFMDVVNTYGPDHLYSMMGGTILGSTETTFYVLAVYFGSVGIRRTRHALPAGLLADAVGIIASVIICRLLFAAV